MSPLLSSLSLKSFVRVSQTRWIPLPGFHKPSFNSLLGLGGPSTIKDYKPDCIGETALYITITIYVHTILYR